MKRQTDRPNLSLNGLLKKAMGPERESENSNSKTLFYKDCRVERGREEREREGEMSSLWRVLGFDGAWGGMGGWEGGGN